MTLIYVVVSVILGAATWVCTQLDWQYRFYLVYFFWFLTSWYISLIFTYEEEYDREKKYTVCTIPHLIYVILDVGALIFLWKYNLKDWKTVAYAKYKLMVILNLVQGIVQMTYFKLRDVYIHL